MFLDTARLILRHFTEADADLLLALDSDPEVMRHLHAGPLGDRETYVKQIRERFLPYYQRFSNRGFWAAVEKASGQFVGWFVLRPAMDYRLAAEVQFRSDDVELGYRTHQAFWGRGYATEVSRALIEIAFQDPGVFFVVATTSAQNVASYRVMEKLGMRRVDGLFALPVPYPPALKYEISRQEFAARVRK
jgi:RimJ/RimL family protein N-acetyltransferase